MRKGRSSRRGRVTRTLVGASLPPPADSENFASEPPNPRIVLGVPPSEPPAAIAEVDLTPIVPAPVMFVRPAELAEDEHARSAALAPSVLEAPSDAVVEPSVPVEPREAAPREPEPQEESVPPAGDVRIDEAFFSEGDLQRHVDGEDDDDTDDIDPLDPLRRKSSAAVRARRQRLGRFVGWAVAGASAVCIVALVIPRIRHTSSASHDVTTRVERTERAVPARVADTPAVAPHPSATQAPGPALSTPEIRPAASVVDARDTSPPPVASSAPVEPGDAKVEKSKARKALERGKFLEAIEAGERAVKLDPADSEAWLLLGAAYQEKGNLPEARRAYAACVKEGKTAARSECAKMLR